EAELEALQHRTVGRIAHGNAVERQERRRQLPWLGKIEARRRLGGGERHRLEPRQHLEAALRLARLGRLGAEAVDEALQMLPLRLLLGGERLLARQRL